MLTVPECETIAGVDGVTTAFVCEVVSGTEKTVVPSFKGAVVFDSSRKVVAIPSSDVDGILLVIGNVFGIAARPLRFFTKTIGG